MLELKKIIRFLLNFLIPVLFVIIFLVLYIIINFNKEETRLVSYVWTGVIEKVKPFISGSVEKKEYTMKEKKEIYKGCKYTNNKVIKDINDSYFICWKRDEIRRVRFLNIELPKKGETQYEEIKEYLKKLFWKRSYILKVLGEKDWIDYVYIFYWEENINYKIIKEQYPFVSFRKDIYDKGIEKIKVKLENKK